MSGQFTVWRNGRGNILEISEKRVVKGGVGSVQGKCKYIKAERLSSSSSALQQQHSNSEYRTRAPVEVEGGDVYAAATSAAAAAAQQQ